MITQDDYGYTLENKSIEELRTQQFINLVKDVPNFEYEVVRSYTKYDMETYEDQCDHIDTYAWWKDKEYHLDIKALESDFIPYVIMELQRRRDHNFKPGIVTRGWIEGNNRLPLEQQIVVEVSEYEVVYYNKRDAYRLINNHKEFFNPEKIPWKQDKGNKPKDIDLGNILWKRNKYLFTSQNEGFDNSYQFELLKELNAKKLHIINGALVPVDILALHPLKYGYSNNKGPVAATTDPSR